MPELEYYDSDKLDLRDLRVALIIIPNVSFAAVLTAFGIVFARTADLSQDQHGWLQESLCCYFSLELYSSSLVVFQETSQQSYMSTLLKAPVLEFEAGKEDAIFETISKDINV